MGKLGSSVGGKLGGKLGEFAGRKLGEIGGSILGGLLPFKKGGRVRKNTKAYLHKGEYVLPAGVKPTKAQISKVKKRGGRK